MGISFRSDMLAQGCIDALEMALENRRYKHLRLIHHSDRGSQYCWKEYVDILTRHNIAVSMTDNRDPYENALAERVNGVIKNKFNLYSSNLSFEQTYELIHQPVNNYNTLRPHGSCDYLTPSEAHKQGKPLKKRWKNYSVTKTNKQQILKPETIL